MDVVTGRKKVVDVHQYFKTERLHPCYGVFDRHPLFIMTSDV